VYRHQFLYVYRQPHESGGLLFPKGIYQSFVGIYISQLTLIGLMILKKAFAQSILCMILFALSVGVILVMKRIFERNPKVEFLPADLIGVVDMKTRKLLVGRNKKDEKNPSNDSDDQEVVRVDEGEGEEFKNERENAFMHPALVAEQPSVWIPNDQNVSDSIINELKKNGIKVTKQGASINEKRKIVIDESKVPSEFRDDEQIVFH
jgi:hypothetical protein